MWQGENDAGLVGGVEIAQAVGIPGVAEHEEAREIVFVVFDALFEEAHAIDWRGSGMADGGVSVQFFPTDRLCRSSSVLGLHHFDLRMALKESATLRQGHRMGIDFLNVGPVFARQAHDAVFDVQFVFADDGGAALP